MGQAPHWICAPQPSPAGPQWMFCAAQVFGVQLGLPHSYPPNHLRNYKAKFNWLTSQNFK